MGGGGYPTGYNSLGQPRELVEWAAAQQIIIWAADRSAMKFVEWQLPYRSAMGGGGCPTGFNSLGQPTRQPMTIVRMGSRPTDYC